MISGHYCRHLSGHGNTDQVGNKNLRPEHGQLNRTHKSEDQAHQKTDEGDNGQGVDTTLLDCQPKV